MGWFQHNEIKCQLISQTSLIADHMSLAVNASESPLIMKQGHSETWTSAVSSAAMANVTGGRPSSVLYPHI